MTERPAMLRDKLITGTLAAVASGAGLEPSRAQSDAGSDRALAGGTPAH